MNTRTFRWYDRKAYWVPALISSISVHGIVIPLILLNLHLVKYDFDCSCGEWMAAYPTWFPYVMACASIIILVVLALGATVVPVVELFVVQDLINRRKAESQFREAIGIHSLTLSGGVLAWIFVLLLCLNVVKMPDGW